MFKNASKEDAEAKFKAISDSIPTDFLRRRYFDICIYVYMYLFIWKYRWRSPFFHMLYILDCDNVIIEVIHAYIHCIHRLISMSSNPETFLTLRTEFAKTLAISSLFGYILGLGYVCRGRVSCIHQSYIHICIYTHKILTYIHT